MGFEGYFLSALPAIISGVILLVLGFLGKWFSKTSKQITELFKEHKILMEKVKEIDDLAEDHEMFMDKVKEIEDFSEDHEFLMYHASQVPDFSGEHKMLMETSQRFTDFYDQYEESSKENKKLMKILMDSQRNQVKSEIVEKYERANARGYITQMELETLNRLAESYFELDGNSYIEAIVNHANEMPIGGMQIPEH